MTITSAFANLISNSVPIKIVNNLGSTTHLQIREIAVSYLETDLHRLTANLAVFNIRLVAATGIQQDADCFPTERATDEEGISHYLSWPRRRAVGRLARRIREDSIWIRQAFATQPDPPTAFGVPLW